MGGPLIGTTYWTGASLQDILVDVRPQIDARYLLITSGDGFYETVDLDLIHSMIGSCSHTTGTADRYRSIMGSHCGFGFPIATA